MDGLKLLIIPDMSTRLSALRTGKLDVHPEVVPYAIEWEDMAELQKSNPELQYTEVPGSPMGLWYRVDKPDLPIYDVEVRRALNLAVDQQLILDTVFGGNADLLAWPPEQAYTTDAPLVVLVHTFEHFEVPSLACDALEFLVQPGNVLFIRTPNAGNIKERPGWFHFWPDHPVLYESRHLVSLLGAYGFYCFRAQGVNNNDDLHLWFVRQ